MFDNPIVQSAVVPLISALILTGVIRFTLGQRIACWSVSLAFFIAYVLIVGLPPFPPVSSLQKLPYLILGGALLGLLLDAIGKAMLTRIATFIFMAVALGWLGWGQLVSLKPAAWIIVFAVGIIGIAALLRFGKSERMDAPIVALVVALGLGAMAFLSASDAIMQLAFALVAAIGGFLLWNWPRHRYPVAMTGALSIGGALLLLAAILLNGANANPIGMGLLALALFAELVLAGVPGFTRRLPVFLTPVLLALITAVPVVLAVLLTFLNSPPSGSY